MKLESQHTHWSAATPKHHLHRWTYTLCLGRLLGGHSAGYFTELSHPVWQHKHCWDLSSLIRASPAPLNSTSPRTIRPCVSIQQVPLCDQPILRRLTLPPLFHRALRLREHSYSWYRIADWTGVGTLPMTLCGHLVLVGPAVLSPLLSVEG